MCGTSTGVVHVFVTDTAGNIKRQLTHTGGWNCDPSWSSDGAKIAWLYQVNNTGWGNAGVWLIKVMTSTGANQSFVINDTQINSKPAWSNDGTKLYFHRMAPLETAKCRLFTIKPDGTALTEIAPFGAATDSSVGNITYPQN